MDCYSGAYEVLNGGQLFEGASAVMHGTVWFLLMAYSNDDGLL